MPEEQEAGDWNQGPVQVQVELPFFIEELSDISCNSTFLPYMPLL